MSMATSDAEDRRDGISRADLAVAAAAFVTAATTAGLAAMRDG
jgi:hypothetical protein